MQAQRVRVTAGASGIGREIALGFAAAGAKVFVVDVDANSLGALEREVPGVRTAVCEERGNAMAIQPVKRFVDPKDIAALAVRRVRRRQVDLRAVDPDRQ